MAWLPAASSRSSPAVEAGVRLRAAAVVAAALATAVFLYLVDPVVAWFLPPCPFLALTGLECPGCGSTRAAHWLLHGEVGRALALNPLLVVYAPVLGWALADRLWLAARGRRLPARRLSPRWIWALLALVCGFWVGRNL